MRRYLIAVFLVVTSLVVVDSSAFAYTDVFPLQAKEMIDSNSDLIIVDVREHGSEYCGMGGHIPCAVNYPWNSKVLQQRYDELPQNADILVV